jgi:shikimate kinase
MGKVQKVSLIGMMGTGKTTVGLELSKKLGVQFCDLDEEIEAQEKRKISEIFEKNGEAYFRDIENNLLKQKISVENAIVLSCGGGAFLSEENRNILLENSIVIWLTASAENIFKRLKGDDSRPLLNDFSLEKIKELITLRTESYKKAHFEIATDSGNIEEICEKIKKCIK